MSYTEYPSNFEHQSNLYFQYKTHTTFKLLIVCTPNDAIFFVWDVNEGLISDRDLFDNSGIVELLEGDLVLADPGFTVQDLVGSKGVHLNIPPFLKRRSKLKAQRK